jgi:hypothetical protein
MKRSLLVAVLLVVIVLPVGWGRCRDENDPPLVFQDNFRAGASAWEPTDAAAWRVVDAGPGKAFSQFKQCAYKPPHRSPLNFALVKDLTLGDFVLDARVKSTAPPGDRRDVCVVFGYKDPAHFYYAHLARKTDDRHNQVFIVDAADRRKITTKTTEGTKWDDQWHRVRVARSTAGGDITVYFDDLQAPCMTASDKTFAAGRVGVGSFDDTADWTDVSVRGVKITERPAK